MYIFKGETLLSNLDQNLLIPFCSIFPYPHFIPKVIILQPKRKKAYRTTEARVNNWMEDYKAGDFNFIWKENQ